MLGFHEFIPPVQYGQKNKFEGKEDDLQVKCIHLFKHLEGPILAYHIANERKTRVQVGKNGSRYSWEGNILKAKGVLPGNSDIIIAHARGGYFGVAMELKTKGNSLTHEQKYMLDWYRRSGYFTALVWSVEGCQEFIREYWGLEAMPVNPLPKGYELSHADPDFL